MANAKITTPDGVSVDISGSPEEVSAVVDRVRAGLASTGATVPARPRKKAGKIQIPDLVEMLKAEEYFKTPRGLGEIRRKFAEMGYHYPITTLSGAMQAQQKSRNLRRFMQGGKYVYVQ
ncbi:MAG TPA: hypothetical protein VN776_13205 [Terracidiphilus sp.]|nr:hypothetical protein [Terracidiphilus sp.]